MSMVTYKDSGVDISKNNLAKKRIGEHVRSTFSKNVLADFGAFGAMYSIGKTGMKDPVLVSSADGVGTKIKLASMSGMYDTVGQDLVNHCLNDILVMGAKPLFFLDYLAFSKAEPMVVEQIVKGVAAACKANGLSLIGGETAQMPGLYSPGDFDLAGFIVGILDRKNAVTGKEIRPGHAVIGIFSNGLQTNGYSLANKVFFDMAKMQLNDKPAGLGGQSIKEALMAIHPSYLKAVQAVMNARTGIKGMAHITGGGLVENIPRVLPKSCSAELDTRSWKVLPVFNMIETLGKVPKDDMYRTFNMGIGFVLVVDQKDEAKTMAAIRKAKFSCAKIGKIVKGGQQVLIR